MNLHETITDSALLLNRHIIRDGFVFTSVTYPYNVFDAIVVKVPNDMPNFSRIPASSRSLEDHIAFINRYQIEKAYVVAEDISFLTMCPSLKYLKVYPADSVGDGFDYSPLYQMPQIKYLDCSTQYGFREEYSTCIDCAKIAGLEDICVTDLGYQNFNTVKTLKSLGLDHYTSSDLSETFCSTILSTLTVTQCKLKSLDGIERSQKLQCLYLYYNRSLRDISALRKVSRTLRALRIQNCPKISDFSVLKELDHLELLELTGKNELPDLGFLKTMRGLKTFVFNMNVKDGDLTPCMRLSYVYPGVDRRHYNYKDKDLPKGPYVRGNETLEEWLRLE